MFCPADHGGLVTRGPRLHFKHASVDAVGEDSGFKHFPAGKDENPNELPDRPVVI